MPKKPVYRAFDDWYVQLSSGGKRVQKKLVKGKTNEAEAYQAFYRVTAASADLPPPTTITAPTSRDLFLGWSEKHNEPATYECCRGYLPCRRSSPPSANPAPSAWTPRPQG
jgi:hypothetical protein